MYSLFNGPLDIGKAQSLVGESRSPSDTTASIGEYVSDAFNRAAANQVNETTVDEPENTPLTPEEMAKYGFNKYDAFNANKLQLEFNKLYAPDPFTGMEKPLSSDEFIKKNKMQQLIKEKRDSQHQSYANRQTDMFDEFANPAYKDTTGMLIADKGLERGESYKQGQMGLLTGNNKEREYMGDSGYSQSEYYNPSTFDSNTQDVASQMYGTNNLEIFSPDTTGINSLYNNTI